MIVVVPPNAAARPPVSNVSLAKVPPNGSSMWVCTSIAPGMIDHASDWRRPHIRPGVVFRLSAVTAVAYRLHFTGDDESDRLLVSEPIALHIGCALVQQVPVQKAVSGPMVLLRRLGTIDAKRLAVMDPAEMDAASKGPPAIHRFPGAMARRVQEL